MKLQNISKAIIFCTVLGICCQVSAAPDTNELLQQQESIIQQKRTGAWCKTRGSRTGKAKQAADDEPA